MTARRALAIAAVAALALSACSTQRTKSDGEGNDGTIVVTASNAAPSLVSNFNLESPTQQAGGLWSFFYEPLIRVDTLNGNTAKPWLASTWKYSDGNKTLTFTLRDDVKFSDGQAMTSQDVLYTLNIPKTSPKLGIAPYGFASATAPDDHTVVLKYATPQYHTLLNFSTVYIVPKHVFAQQDLSTWTNPKPVATGAYTLTSFSPQQAKLKVRDNYWGGKFKGVKNVVIRAFSSVQTAQEQLLQNKIQFSTLALQNPQQTFVGKDPKNNKYFAFPLGGSEGLLFNQQKAPTNDVYVRRALYAAVDQQKLKQIFDNGQGLTNDSGLNSQVWGELVAPEFRANHKTDDTAAKKALADGGWTVRDGNLTKGGKSYPLTITAIAEYTNWAAWADGLAAQWQAALGLKVGVKKLTATVEASQEAAGNYDICFDFLMGQNDIYSALKFQLDGSSTPKLRTPATSNLARYVNPQVTTWLNQMAATDDQTTLQNLAWKVQRQAVADAVYAPLDASSQFSEANTTNWKGWPANGSTQYIPHTLRGPDTTLTMMNLTPAG